MRSWRRSRPRRSGALILGFPLGSDLRVLHRQEDERFGEARQRLNASGPGGDVGPCRKIAAGQLGKGDVGVAADIGNGQRATDEKTTFRKMSVQDV